MVVESPARFTGQKIDANASVSQLPARSAAQFPQPQQYEGRTVAVSGKITLRRGKPEIIVTSPAQIRAQ
jgi:DNA/RNA endonuclease YhcR with UshA esterase domain